MPQSWGTLQCCKVVSVILNEVKDLPACLGILRCAQNDRLAVILNEVKDLPAGLRDSSLCSE